jgi:AcrR family transcriptional regulator
MPTATPDPSAPTPRFQAKRTAILNAASALINEHGVRGLTLAEVAEVVGLSNTSVTYYFKRKEQLAAACFHHALDHLERQLAEAGTRSDPQARVIAFIDLSFDAIRAAQDGSAFSVVRLHDLRATDEPARAELIARYFGILRQARTMFGDDPADDARRLRLVRAHVLLENMFALPTWLERYAVEEYRRVRDRLIDLFVHGFAVPDAGWRPVPLELPEEGTPARRNFLGAASRLINERGYRGASVELIAAELNVTKGSFYHHLDAKDDLVLECFLQSLATVSKVQDASFAIGGDHYAGLVAALASLLKVQFSDASPLVRTTALLALPQELRRKVIDRSNQIARRFAGMLIDGISEGSVARIDPLITGQVLMATVNAAYELRAPSKALPLDRAVELYASTIVTGLFDDRAMHI